MKKIHKLDLILLVGIGLIAIVSALINTMGTFNVRNEEKRAEKKKVSILSGRRSA